MRRSLCCAVTAAVLAIVGVASATADTGPGQREMTLEQAILHEVNHVRSDRGLRPLTASRSLVAAAAFQSKALLTQGLFDHDTQGGGAFGDRLRRFYPVGSARAWSVGENLLWSSVGIDAATAIQRWLDSPPHRHILLDPTWREFGIGALGTNAAPGVYAAAGPVVVVTMDFGVRR
jgi:uncharacterized protein YkwD